jgi:DNA-binding Xre family transcriptional regulator
MGHPQVVPRTGLSARYVPAVARLRARLLSQRIAALLSARMLELGVSQRALAASTGISQSTVSRHLTAGGMPVDSLDLYCRALGLSLVDVVKRAV